MKITNEKFLREKENQIKSSISRGEIQYAEAFNFLHKHYLLKNLSGEAPLLSVFEAIYIMDLTIPAWKLAIRCNVSRTTLFNYRNTIVKDFYICLTENLIEETAATKGKSL